MACLIPDDVLDTLKCSVCLKYLSVKPIKVYPNRKTRCGRCSEDKDNGLVSLYEAIVENSLFRCVNRYEGCSAVLTCEDMKLHENECKGGFYECCICSQFKGTAYGYLQHFKTQHKHLILDKTNFVLNVSEDKEKHYMYNKNDLLFIILVKVDTKSEFIILDCIHIGPEEMSKKLKTQFELYEEDRIIYSTEEKVCSSKFILQSGILLSNSKINFKNNNSSISCVFKLDLSNSPSFLYLPLSNKNKNSLKVKNRNCSKLCLCKEYSDLTIAKIYVPKELQLKYSTFKLSKCGCGFLYNGTTKFDFFCSNCEYLCNPFWGILECKKCNDFVCNLCYTFVNMDVCNKGFKLEQNPTVRDIFNKLKIYCKWSCGKYFLSSDIISHQKECESRPKQFCPVVNCSWYGKLSQLEKHFEVHSKVLFVMSNRIDENIVVNTKDIVYLYTDKDIIVVIEKVKVNINSYKCKILEVLPQINNALLHGAYNVMLQEFKNSQLVTDSFIFNTNKVLRVILKEKS